MNGKPAMRQFDRNRRRDGRFADAAFSHQHHEAMAVDGDTVHQFRKARRAQLDRLAIAGRPIVELLQRAIGAMLSAPPD